jgi:hypothetical protein
MKLRGILIGTVAVVLASGVSARAEEKDEEVQMSKVPDKVRKTIEQYASASEIKKIEKGDVDGKTAYEFDIEKAGKKSEVTILPNGKLLSTEEEVALTDIPDAARNSINDAVGTGKLVSTEKVLEKGKVAYEAVIEKNGKKTELTVAPDGKVTGTEDAEEGKESKKDKD